MTATQDKARAKVAKLSTEDLIRVFEGTDQAIDKADAKGDADERSHVVRVRGWLIDELGRRDPEAFQRWIAGDADTTDLRREFLRPETVKVGLIAGVGFVMQSAE